MPGCARRPISHMGALRFITQPDLPSPWIAPCAFYKLETLKQRCRNQERLEVIRRSKESPQGHHGVSTRAGVSLGSDPRRYEVLVGI